MFSGIWTTRFLCVLIDSTSDMIKTRIRLLTADVVEGYHLHFRLISYFRAALYTQAFFLGLNLKCYSSDVLQNIHLYFVSMSVWREIKLQRSHDDMSCSLWANYLCKYPVVCDPFSVSWCQRVWDDTEINLWVFSPCAWRHMFGFFKPLETMSDISWHQRFSSCCWKWLNTGSDIIRTHFSEITSSIQEHSWVRSHASHDTKPSGRRSLSQSQTLFGPKGKRLCLFCKQWPAGVLWKETDPPRKESGLLQRVV